MTATQQTPTLRFGDLDEAVAAVRARGLRLSSARRLVLEGLFAADGPVTAEQLADGLDGRVPRSDTGSVYRNLETLERLGLVRHSHVGHGPGLYALTGREAREYLVCDRCGGVAAVVPASLDAARAAIREAHGFQALFTHFPVGGLCASCAVQGGTHAHP